MKKQVYFLGIIGTIIISSLLTSCEKGKGDPTNRSFNIDNISGVDNKIDADIYIYPSPVQEISVTGQENILDLIETTVHNGIWEIGFRHAVRKHDQIKIEIGIPSISDLIISGSGNISTSGTFDSVDNVNLRISGSGNIETGLRANNVDCEIAGSGSISITGECTSEEMTISGSGSINASGLLSQDSRVDISGSGSCRVWAENNLRVRISGSGDVYYRGYPTIDFSNSGSGSLFSTN